MRHHRYNPEFVFVEPPVDFDKFTDKRFLQFCLGGTLYMPGTKDFCGAILDNKIPALTSMVMCFEDAICEEDVPAAEENVINFLSVISEKLDSGEITYESVPLVFLRVRDTQQMRNFSSKLVDVHMKVLAGFVFPKFSKDNGKDYLEQVKHLREKHQTILYGMPILESRDLALKETRQEELAGIRKLVSEYRDLVLNVRVGATDLSSIFGVRRGINYTVYDIIPVRDCLADVLNFLHREEDDCVISAPVWEYFLADKSMKFKKTLEGSLHNTLLTRNLIVNEAIDGLLREVIIDRANGFVGKTVIHPSHLPYVNAMQAVTREEYEDAVQILEASGGVIKSAKSNKMNEINPHRSWAKRIAARAKAYGVVEDESSYLDLFC